MESVRSNKLHRAHGQRRMRYNNKDDIEYIIVQDHAQHLDEFEYTRTKTNFISMAPTDTAPRIEMDVHEKKSGNWMRVLDEVVDRVLELGDRDLHDFSKPRN